MTQSPAPYLQTQKITTNGLIRSFFLLLPEVSSLFLLACSRFSKGYFSSQRESARMPLPFLFVTPSFRAQLPDRIFVYDAREFCPVLLRLFKGKRAIAERPPRSIRGFPDLVPFGGDTQGKRGRDLLTRLGRRPGWSPPPPPAGAQNEDGLALQKSALDAGNTRERVRVCVWLCICVHETVCVCKCEHVTLCT